jgi:hypothetical protein
MRRSAIAIVFACFAASMPDAAVAQNYGHSPVSNTLSGPGAGPGWLAVDWSGKVHPAAPVAGAAPAGDAFGRNAGPPGLEIAPPPLEGGVRVNGSSGGGKLKVSGPPGSKQAGLAGPSKGGPQSKKDIRQVPTCE